jgi:hypothetical protein
MKDKRIEFILMSIKTKSLEELKDELVKIDKSQRMTDCGFEFDNYLRKRNHQLELIKLKSIQNGQKIYHQ